LLLSKVAARWKRVSVEYGGLWSLEHFMIKRT